MKTTGKKVLRRVLCLYGFHDFRNTSVPHFLLCTRIRCGSYRKVSSY